jgi:hypothetical protein
MASRASPHPKVLQTDDLYPSTRTCPSRLQRAPTQRSILAVWGGRRAGWHDRARYFQRPWPDGATKQTRSGFEVGRCRPKGGQEWILAGVVGLARSRASTRRDRLDADLHGRGRNVGLDATTNSPLRRQEKPNFSSRATMCFLVTNCSCTSIAK